jgi:hypothetical protein
MSLAPGRRGAYRHSGDWHGEYGKRRGSPFTFPVHPEIAPDSNGSEHALRLTATYRKVTEGFRSTSGADHCGAVRSYRQHRRQTALLRFRLCPQRPEPATTVF